MIAGLIQAHMPSTRLPGKVLLKVKGKELLLINIERLRKCKSLDMIAVITSGSPLDDPIVQFCEKHNVLYYRGSDRDVLDRYYKAAKHFKADMVVRLLSDCPLIDPKIVDMVVGELGVCDFVSNSEPAKGGTFPDGMDVSVFTFDALERGWREAEDYLEREHVTPYFYNSGDFTTKRIDSKADLSKYRFTVDYPEDLERIRHLAGCETMIDLISKWGELGFTHDHKFGEGWHYPVLSKLKITESEKLWDKVKYRIPIGAQTFSKMPNQYVNGVAPKFLQRGKGCRVWDIDGNEFIDLSLGLGAVILGHANDEVNNTAFEAARDFNAPSLPHSKEFELAEKICELVPCAEMVRFAKNGSDVTSAAVKLARAITGREHIACKGYHGWHDWYIGATNRHIGIPQCVRDLTHPFGDLVGLESILKEYSTACVIIEPMDFEWSGTFVREVKKLAHQYGALLIFDEMVVGFRACLGSVQSLLGVEPDIVTFGKSIANGYPLSVIAGRAEYMKRFEDVFFSMTHGGDIMSISAGLKTIEIIERDRALYHIDNMGSLLKHGYNTIARRYGYSEMYGYGWWLKYDFPDMKQMSIFRQEMIKRGILTRNTPFICYEHNEPDIREILNAVEGSMKAMKEGAELEGDMIIPIIRDEFVRH